MQMVLSVAVPERETEKGTESLVGGPLPVTDFASMGLMGTDTRKWQWADRSLRPCCSSAPMSCKHRTDCAFVVSKAQKHHGQEHHADCDLIFHARMGKVCRRPKSKAGRCDPSLSTGGAALLLLCMRQRQ